MRNLYDIVLVTIYVLTYNHANGDDAEDRRLKYLRDKAANCVVGTIIKDDDVCNWCKCEAKGVLVCTLIGCEAKKNVDQKDYPGLNALDGEVYDEIETFNKIRGIASRCKVGNAIQRDCIVCECQLPGVMSCERLRGCRRSRPPPPPWEDLN